MESALVQFQPPSTDLSLSQRAQDARAILILPTSATFALKAVKQLVGCYPQARPPEPETYAAALASALAGYPQGVVSECVDPRVGLPRKLKYPPTVADIVEWCDSRMAYYRSLASYQAREIEAEREYTDDDRARARAFMADLARELKSRHLRAAIGE